jgi:hypothetical protein
VDIAEVARRSGIPASALRYYEEKRLIASVGRRGLGVPDVSPVAPGGRVRRPGRAHVRRPSGELHEGRHRLRAIPAANGPVVNEHHEVDRGAATVAKVSLDMTAGVAGLRARQCPRPVSARHSLCSAQSAGSAKYAQASQRTTPGRWARSVFTMNEAA